MRRPTNADDEEAQPLVSWLLCVFSSNFSFPHDEHPKLIQRFRAWGTWFLRQIIPMAVKQTQMLIFSPRGTSVACHHVANSLVNLWLAPASHHALISAFRHPQTKEDSPKNKPTSPPTSRSGAIPVGGWRDSIWDLCILGPLHATVWNACCCVAIGAGQLATRLQLNQWGYPTQQQAALAFGKLWLLGVSYSVLRVFLILLIAILDPNTETEEWIEPGWAYHILVFADDILAYVYWVFTAWLLKNIRQHVRAKYAIPLSGDCPVCEDCCCSMVCPCLVLAQMMRHTADYQTHGGRCCTEHGLPEGTAAVL